MKLFPNLTLSILADNFGKPDFNNVVANSTISGASGDFDGKDFAFGFSSPVNLNTGSTYWLGLTFGHSGSADWTANYWKNAVGYNTSLTGEAGQVCVDTGGNMRESTFSTSPAADWYVKLGLQR